MESRQLLYNRDGAEVPGWSYEGPAYIHDATLESVEDNGDSVSVVLSTYHDTHRFTLTFHGVTERNFVKPERMMLYSLSTQRRGAQTCYVLTNWDEDGDAYFSVVAERFEASELRPVVRVDLPEATVASLDRQAKFIGITREDLIKFWIAERLNSKVTN